MRVGERAAISSERSSFGLCQRLIVYYGSGWVSCTFTLCDKTADHHVHFNHATTASSTFTTFIYALHGMNHILNTETYQDNAQPPINWGILAQNKNRRNSCMKWNVLSYFKRSWSDDYLMFHEDFFSCRCTFIHHRSHCIIFIHLIFPGISFGINIYFNFNWFKRCGLNSEKPAIFAAY